VPVDFGEDYQLSTSEPPPQTELPESLSSNRQIAVGSFRNDILRACRNDWLLFVEVLQSQFEAHDAISAIRNARLDSLDRRGFVSHRRI
jgi:hypothetical protein